MKISIWYKLRKIALQWVGLRIPPALWNCESQ